MSSSSLSHTAWVLQPESVRLQILAETSVWKHHAKLKLRTIKCKYRRYLKTLQQIHDCGDNCTETFSWSLEILQDDIQLLERFIDFLKEVKHTMLAHVGNFMAHTSFPYLEQVLFLQSIGCPLVSGREMRMVSAGPPLTDEQMGLSDQQSSGSDSGTADPGSGSDSVSAGSGVDSGSAGIENIEPPILSVGPPLPIDPCSCRRNRPCRYCRQLFGSDSESNDSC